MQTSLWRKASASAINVGIVSGVAYFFLPFVDTYRDWQILTAIGYCAYSYAFRDRDPGMWAVGSAYEGRPPHAYVLMSSAGFAALGSATSVAVYCAVQAVAIMATGTTLHGWLTGVRTVRRSHATKT